MNTLRPDLRAAAMMFGGGIVLAISGCASAPPPPRPGLHAGRDCPQWTLFPVDRFSNADSPYLGCVSASNLRAMVANPEDLDRGRPLGPADGDRATRAIETYRAGPIKPFQGSGASGPTSSGGAQ